MLIDVFARSDVGRVRQRNEDAVGVDSAVGLFVVADGMGGHQGGRTASHLAVRTVLSLIDEAAETDRGEAGDAARQALGAAIGEASAAIYCTAQQDGATHGMGTTTTALWLVGTKAHVAHVGDSRLYLRRDEDLVQITHDHSLVQEHLRAGLITAEEAEHSGYRNIITRSVGFEQNVEVDTLAFDVRSGDVFLLCSDGLSNLVTPQDLETAMAMPSLASADGFLVTLANDRGADDNISVILLRTASGAEPSVAVPDLVSD